jgi:hypothetical protein
MAPHYLNMCKVLANNNQKKRPKLHQARSSYYLDWNRITSLPI